MAYTESAISAITDAPALIRSFASSAGWTVDGSGNITRPGGGQSFSVGANYNGPNNQNGDLYFIRNDDTTKIAYARGPRLNGVSANAPFVPAPTKLHCIGGTVPEAYLGVVVEYGFNLYRHLYLGNMVKLGSYTGGEVFSANNHYDWGVSFNYSFDAYIENNMRYLFSANNLEGVNFAGGVHVVHADNPVPWRSFSGLAGLQPATFPANWMVLGGLKDSVNDHYTNYASSTFSGAAILVPINLWCPKTNSGGATLYAPIGHPAGVRMLRMDGLTPGQSVEVGNKIWRIFPEFRKLETSFIPRGTFWNAYESSGVFGLAYLEEN